MSLILSISGHTSDCFGATLLEDGRPVRDYDGYVLSCVGGGDDIRLDIDLQTGQIQNWKPVTKQEVIEQMGQEEDEDLPEPPKKLSGKELQEHVDFEISNILKEKRDA
jgi:hypothetical protein